MTDKNYFVDSHCHLDFLQRDGLAVADVIARAKENGVGKFLSISTKMETFPSILQIADAFPDVYAAVGVHPHDSDEAMQEGATIKLSADILLHETKHPKVIGIGESGLDFFYDHSDRKNQEESFRTHLAVARQTGLPIIVHSRSADQATIDVLRSESDGGKLTGLIHCFSSGRDLAMGALDLGFYISLSGILTFPKAQDIRDVVRDVPLDRLLLETDSPYLAPIPHRGRKNEPSFLPNTAKVLAEVKNVSLEEIRAITTENFFRLFSKA
ncbi:MAG: TatD family hydrolase [Hydrotalea sp.]|nr:TatD family hydrolase [Hydrotalea sp.]